ncbi:MAG: metalloregulator ArsR/SmtB family transcription factor [Acidobacteria bacterium]|nr:metalloregulator ArsR/SmtB family transcription factor [Acidobacteriota bacterium]
MKSEIKSEEACAPNDPEHRRRLAPPVDEASIEAAARIFRAMGDPSRLRTLAMLSHGEACVSEIAAATREELSTISQRLRVLRSENLLVRRRQGKHILYSLADQHVAGLVFNALAHSTEKAVPVGVTKKVTKGKE